MEIRIYYECLEQAEYFIKPSIEKTLKNQKIDNYEIKLIAKVQQNYKNGVFTKKYAKSISNILIHKNPDIIISIIKNNTEIPISIIEFSTAVFTKDHELQRTDNFNVAFYSKAVYIKISPNKKTTQKHGGDTKYNYLQTYAMYYQNMKEISFHIDWEVTQEDSRILIKHPQYKSIPNKIKELENIFFLVFKTYISNINNDYWKYGFEEAVKNDPNYSEWYKKLAEFKDFEDIKKLNTKRTKWSSHYSNLNLDNVFSLKFNRYTHSMDPERGMLSYYGTFYKSEHNIIMSEMFCNPQNDAWYKIKSENKMNEINQLINKNSISTDNMIKIMFLSLNLQDYDFFVKNLKKINNTLDITDYIKKYFLYFNISFRTIITKSDYFHLYDNSTNEVFLTWNMDEITSYLLKSLPDSSDISLRDDFSEDDVTFITINNFFNENGINTFSVSYPGAQSDTPLLPDKYSGRSQDRTYVDAVGIKGDSLIFQENKGPFNKSEINDDLSKMKKFRVDVNYTKAVDDFKSKYGLVQTQLVLGVGFGMGTRTQVDDIYSKTSIEDVDYFLIITKDMSKWKVYSNLAGNEQPFVKLNGEIERIKTYKVN